MPTTTTNFGWTVPSDTDLVKDGAAAIRTALGGVDTSLVDLKGGTSGQVLAKNSNTDMDFIWVAQDDSNAIQNAIVDAKGDLISATAADTPARLAVGANNTVLTADSSTATGLKWATPPASTPTFVGCKATQASAWSIANGTNNVFAFPNEEFDTDGFHSTTTNNGRITIPTGKGGYYMFTFTIGQETTAGQIEFYFRKNGSTLSRFDSDDAISYSHNFTIFLNVAAGDYFDISVYNNTGGNVTQVGETSFVCVLLGV